MMVNALPSQIFREYDIRGVWGKDLTEEIVAAIGRAYSVYLKEKTGKENPKITIGRDVRLSSPPMFAALSGAILKSGIDVIDIGMVPTPLQYFSLFTLPVDGGVMITASHNPAEFNGMKLSVGRDTLFGEKIQEIRKYAEAGKSVRGSGTMSVHEIIPEYAAHMKKQFTSFEGLNAIVDCGNGVAGLVAPALIKELGGKIRELYCEPDGRFPNHHPDPVVPENIKEMIGEVKKGLGHIGIGYDGDADRLGIVDEGGDMVWGDKLLVIFSRDLLKTHPGAMVIGEVKCSQTLYDDIAKHGGEPLMWKTGHSLIKDKMKETGALLAGEMSGHLFFKDRYFGYDDAIYASFRLLEILKKNGPPYSVKKLLAGLPPMMATPEIRVDCPDEKKFQVVSEMKEELKDYPMIDIDGVRVQFPDGWGLIRASNTQPALVMRFEASDERKLEEYRRVVEERLRPLL
jgi:phosphomannomutase/phosphoglucomutase